MSEANGTLGTKHRIDPTLKGSNTSRQCCSLSASILFSRPNLGIRSLHSLLPRLYRFVAFGDFFWNDGVASITVQIFARRDLNADPPRA